MNKKLLKTLSGFAEAVGLAVDPKLGVIYGVYNSYEIFLTQVNSNSYSFIATFSISKNQELPSSEQVKQVVNDSKNISDCAVQGYQVSYTFKGAMTVAKTKEKLVEGLDTVTHFLKENQYQNACQFCGTVEEQVDLYSIGGVPTIACSSCFKKQNEAVAASEREQKQKKENLLAGIVGAVLGSLIGAGIIILLGQLGYVAALSGIAMAICSLKGYEFLGGKLSNKGIIASVIIMIIMVYLGNRIDWSISVANYYTDVDYFYAFRILPDLLREGYLEASQYYGNLVLVYLFTAIGAIPTIIGVLRDRKNSRESYKMEV
jgi:hypothetical protein